MAKKDDLRYRRTEASIRSSFMELVATTPVSKVTVSAICRRAGISRNAFYLHHLSVSALYGALVDELVEDVHVESLASSRRVAATGNVDLQLVPAIMDALGRHEELLRALLPSDDGSLAKRLALGLEEAYLDAGLLLGKNAGGFRHRMNCAFAAWAHVGFVMRWTEETERPLIEALPLFEEMQTGITAFAAKLLME